MSKYIRVALLPSLIFASAPSVLPGAGIAVDASNPIAPVSYRQLGINLGYWGADVTDPAVSKAIDAVGARLIRWPGGSNSDNYHWATHTECAVTNNTTVPWTYAPEPAYPSGNTFPNFVSKILTPGREAIVTVNYGSNGSCNGGAIPSEAAAWVSYAKDHGLNIQYWTIGNEQYGSWSTDFHLAPHQGSMYAANVAGPAGFYATMKAANPAANVGVVIEGAGWNYRDGWDKAVLSNAPFDFIELHWYAQDPGSESDAYLLNQAPAAFTAMLNTVRAELSKAGKSAATPIVLGEFNSVGHPEGKQTMSIVNALFLGQMFGEIVKDKIEVAATWFGTGGTQGCGSNNSDSLYGWQNFGGYDLIAYKTQYDWNDCDNGPTVLEGTVFPAGYAQYLATQFAHDGEHLLNVAVDPSLANVKAYAATQGSGYAYMLFNLDDSNPQTVSLEIDKQERQSFTASALIYGKAQYDDSQNNIWTGPVSQSLGIVGTTFTVSLPPWSMVVVKLQ
jgi:hypothetical protein